MTIALHSAQDILGITDKQKYSLLQAAQPYIQQRSSLLTSRTAVLPLLLPPHPPPRAPQLAFSMSAATAIDSSLREEAKLQEELVNRCFLEILQPHQTAQLLVCCYPHLVDGVGFAVHVAGVAEQQLRISQTEGRPPVEEHVAGRGEGRPGDDVIRSVQHMMGIKMEGVDGCPTGQAAS